MKIDIILPYKEIFSESKASSVSITIKNSMKFSQYRNEISVYGQFTDNPIFKKNFIGIKTNRFLHGGNNISIVKNYLKIRKNKNEDNDIIEIHNRPYLFNFLTKKINLPIVLYYHNDPLTMKGSKSVLERQNIIKNAGGIICVSNYIKDRLLEGIANKPCNVFVLPNSLDKNPKSKNKKKKEVVFVGKLVPEKGPDVYVDAVKLIANKFIDWKFYIIGSSKAGLEKPQTRYEKEIIDSFLAIGKNVKYYGFLPHSKVCNILQKASILVVPSTWHEPFGLTALEGIANRQAVIASKIGGLVDIVAKKGILIQDINKIKIANRLSNLMKNNDELKKYQNRAWKNYNFDQKNISKKQDKMRRQIIKKFNFFKT